MCRRRTATEASDRATDSPWNTTTVIEIVLLLLVVATVLAFVARRIGVAYPIVLVLGGVVLGLILSAFPEHPSVELPPELVFLLFLPPILFGAGYFTPIRDFKANLRPIGLLAVGLVLFTTVVVGGGRLRPDPRARLGGGARPSARSWRRPTRSRRRRSSAGSGSRRGSSRSSRARASSTTRPP